MSSSKAKDDSRASSAVANSNVEVYAEGEDDPEIMERLQKVADGDGGGGSRRGSGELLKEDALSAAAGATAAAAAAVVAKKNAEKPKKLKNKPPPQVRRPYTRGEIMKKIAYQLEIGRQRTIQLTNMKLSAKEMKILADGVAMCPSVRKLHFGYNNFKDKGMLDLGTALCSNSSVKVVELDGNELTAKGLVTFGPALAMPECKLEYLYLAYNSLGAEGAALLAEGLMNNNSVTRLFLAETAMGDVGFTKLAEVLATNTVLRHLNCESNGIGPAGAEGAATPLGINSTLTHLMLTGNALTDVGAVSIAVALRNNKGLERLGLSDNSIGDEGTKAIAEALGANANAVLKELELSSNFVSCLGAQQLGSELVNNQTLRVLSVSNNKIGSEGALFLAGAISGAQGCGVQHLLIDGNQLDSGQADAVRAALNPQEIFVDGAGDAVSLVRVATI